MVLEQNAVPGLTNRLLAPWVRAAAVTYEDTLPFFRGRGFVTGNPVRAEFFARDAGDGARATRVLILGGSQGAHQLNMAMVAAAPRMVRGAAELEIVHQTGERDVVAVRQAYRDAGIDARAESFLDPVAVEMTRADLVIGRAGATTLAELAAAAKPAVLVPFPAATDDHQRKNAQVLAAAGAAVVVDERELTGDRLADVVMGLVADRAGLARMGQAMAAFAKPDAAARIVDRVLALAAR
jgi:UDP-N-acetylglucosamine--N-acetylmuramyl-(pentapeptide) pyrophosphoryl-undecaprenol N-acetylglucosamine transferase